MAWRTNTPRECAPTRIQNRVLIPPAHNTDTFALPISAGNYAVLGSTPALGWTRTSTTLWTCSISGSYRFAIFPGTQNTATLSTVEVQLNGATIDTIFLAGAPAGLILGWQDILYVPQGTTYAIWAPQAYTGVFVFYIDIALISEQ